MPAAKKSGRRQLGPREKKVYNRLMWLLIGPAVFFALYWIYSGGGAESDERVAIPQSYRLAGDTAVIDGQEMQAAPGGRITVSGELSLGSNRVIADSGRLFAVIPLVMPDNSSDPSPSRWFLADMESRRHDLLKVLDRNPVRDAQEDQIPGRGKRVAYMVFKINREAGDTFLVYKSPAEQQAWKIPRSSRAQ